MTDAYQQFLERKTHIGSDDGFAPSNLPDALFPFQAAEREMSMPSLFDLPMEESA